MAAMRAGEPTGEHHHRNVNDGAARAAVFGVSDGLVTNIALILGVAGAHPGSGVVRLAGLAGLISGAFSMSAGEYVSMRAQNELLEREIEIERVALDRRPEAERRELAQLYRSRGVDRPTAESMAQQVHANVDVALATHAREELGINPESLGSPLRTAVSSFATFAVGAVVPLAPWLITKGAVAVIASIVLATVAAGLVGVALARFTGRSTFRAVARQILIAASAAAVTFAVGTAVGVSTG